MKRLFTLLSAIVLLASFGSSHAQGYFAASVGQTSPDDDGFDDSNGYKLTIGYNANPNVAIEGSLTNLGEFDADDDVLALLSFLSGLPVEDASVEVDGIEFAVVGKAPLSDTVSLFGRVGMFMWDAEYSFDLGPFGSDSDSDDGSDLFFGAGVNVNISPKVSLNFEYVLYDVDGEDIDYIGGGLAFNF